VIETLLAHPGPVKDFWPQMFLYTTGATLSFVAFYLFAAWLYRIRHQWEQLALGWLIFGLVLDRLAYGLNETLWGLTKLAVGKQWVDASWLAQSGWFPKMMFMVANTVVIFSYFAARKQDRK